MVKFLYRDADGIIKEQEQNAVEKVQIVRKASVAISAMQLVKSTSATHVGLAIPDGNYQDAKVLGVALTAANIGDDVTILVFGTLVDGTFAGFSLNDTVYLAYDSFLTQTIPTSDRLVRLGKAIGNNTVFIQIEEPILL